MNLERMQALIRATEEAKDEDFTMSNFTTNCGTPACVLGNYAARGDLQNTFTFDGSRTYAVCVDGMGIPCTDRAILDHFDIDEGEAEALFSEWGCGYAGRNKKKAIAFLRAFVAARTP